MKKDELKKAFETEFQKILVSDELKEKTLNAINNAKPSKMSYAPYIRNIAAIFVVTLLCVSTFLVRSNKSREKTSQASDNVSSYSSPNQATGSTDNAILLQDSLKSESTELFSSAQIESPRLSKSIKAESLNAPSNSISEDLSDYKAYETDAGLSRLSVATPAEKALTKSAPYNSNLIGIKEEAEETTKEDFLIQHPEAKKLEDVYQDEDGNIYIFENNLLKDIIKK